MMKMNKQDSDNIKEAIYLVVGAGAAGLSFIDTILTLDANATVYLSIATLSRADIGQRPTPSFVSIKLVVATV